MKSKFSIVEKLNLDILNNKIDSYMIKTGETNPYIFMNKQTAREIGSTVVPPLFPSFKQNDHNGLLVMYEGYPVYINNDLDFGEIELR